VKKVIKKVLKEMSAYQVNLSSEYCRELIAAEIVAAIKKEKTRRENVCAE